MNTTPVYKGKVVTATGYDRLGKFVKFVWRADKADERKAAKEAAGDTITFVGKPRKALPGEVPAATAKSIQQERAEKVAAKLVSRNKQVAANRESTKAKRQASPTPAVQVEPRPAPKVAKPVNPRAAKPIVNISKGTYHPSRSAAERENNTGENNIAYKLHKRHPTRIQGDIYDYATPAEEQAGKCLRSVTDELVTLVDAPAIVKPMGPRVQRQYRAVVNLSTGAYYASQSVADKSLGCFRDHVRRMFRRHGDADTVRVMGNLLSYATEKEQAAKACLRNRSTKQHLSPVAKPMLLIDTGEIYETVGAIAAAAHLSRRRFTHMQPGEIRQTPAGATAGPPKMRFSSGNRPTAGRCR